eukprot:scaffold90034_cov21-Tisochrysis_lutea.AAC.1
MHGSQLCVNKKLERVDMQVYSAKPSSNLSSQAPKQAPTPSSSAGQVGIAALDHLNWARQSPSGFASKIPSST